MSTTDRMDECASFVFPTHTNVYLVEAASDNNRHKTPSPKAYQIIKPTQLTHSLPFLLQPPQHQPPSLAHMAPSPQLSHSVHSSPNYPTIAPPLEN